MDFSKISEFLNSSTVQNLAGTLLKKPAPAPSVPSPVIQVQNPISLDSGMSKTTMIMIAVGAVVGVLGLIFALRK